MSNALFWSKSPPTRPVTGSLHFTTYREGTGFLAVRAFSGWPCAGQGQSAPEARLPTAGADDTPSPGTRQPSRSRLSGHGTGTCSSSASFQKETRTRPTARCQASSPGAFTCSSVICMYRIT